LVDGTVEIVGIAREPGHRTKIAVVSHDPNVDPKGACVGARGSRVRQVVNELRGEKVDVVQHREDTRQFIAEALGPAKIKDVIIDEEEKVAEVIVGQHQLSLAIGKEGQNARLAARLSGYKIDIRSDEPEPEPESAVIPVPDGEALDHAPAAEAPAEVPEPAGSDVAAAVADETPLPESGADESGDGEEE
jgi:transcription termination/antitermination protein NusA